jgi:hypothetical protein
MERAGIDSGTARLTQRERRTLLEDIGLLGLMLGRDLASAVQYELPLRAGPTRSAAVAPLERLRLLEALWPQVQTALGALILYPNQKLTVSDWPIPLIRSRGGPAVANALARTPAGQAAWGAAIGNNKATRSRNQDALSSNPPSMRELRSQPTTDTPANRFVVTLLLAIVREATALAELAAFCGEATEARRAERLAASAARWRATAWLRDIKPLALQEQSLLLRAAQALGPTPPYRVLLDAWHTLRQQLRFDWAESPLLCLPSIEAWRLYEIWCFLRVGVALQTSGWRVVGGDVLRWEAAGLRLVPQTGRASRLYFVRAPVNDAEAERLELVYQPLFPSANQNARRRQAQPDRSESDTLEPSFYALSHAMQPDIALRWQGHLYLLDAKFRAYTPPVAAEDADTLSQADANFVHQNNALLDDIDKMHAYRDAIVRGGQPAVKAAWCLFPGQSNSGPDRIAYPTDTPESPFGTAGVGALRLRPGHDCSLLTTLLTQWFTDPR